MSAGTVTKTNGSDFMHEPKLDEGAIPEPKEGLPEAKVYDATGRTYKDPTMTQKAQSWLQQHIVTIALVVITGVVTFTYQQFQVSALTKENAALSAQMDKDKTEMKALIAENKAEAKKDIADAQAYGVSALSQARFMQGLLIGKGIANPQDFQQQR